MLNMNKEEIKQEQNKGLIARILGGTPTILQKVFFILMAFSLILWPLGCYVSIFFFDAPVRSDVDKICRYGMLITICLYPIYLFPLLRFMFQLSKNLRATWLYYLCPIVPILILRLLFSISTISAPKIDNTDFCTNEDLVGHWTLNGGERQINYPEIEFFNDSTVELYSQADTLYRYTYCLQNDSLYLNDINGRQYVNKINKVDDETIMFEGIADVKGIQIYHK